MNFSEWLDANCEPEYTVEGKDPKCPKGFKWDKKLNTCVPKAGENPNQKALGAPRAMYNVIGSHGMNGEPPAIGVPGDEESNGDAVSEATMSLSLKADSKELKKREDQERAHKAQDDRMRYGRRGKPAESDELLPGEVRKYNKKTGKWESNKR